MKIAEDGPCAEPRSRQPLPHISYHREQTLPASQVCCWDLKKTFHCLFSWFVRCDQSSGPWSDDHQFEVVQNFWPGSGSNDIRRPKEIQQSHFTCNMTKVQACSSFTANPTWSITKVGCILHILNDWIRNDQYNPDYPDWLVVCRYRTVKTEIRISLGFYCIHAIFFIN